MKNTLFKIIPIILLSACQNSSVISEKLKMQTYTEEQKEIIEEYHGNCAAKFSYTFNHHQYQACLDKGLEKDPSISYLWQQKAMPYFKARKYAVGMQYLDKAVQLNKMRYLSYRAFIKCIFSKQYREAIDDFNAIKALEGNSIVMDHSYDFYTALSYLQLNEFEKAEKLFRVDIAAQVKEWGQAEYHHLSSFYLAIALFELEKWEESAENFDLSLEKNNQFSEAHYYKSICLANLERFEEAKKSYQMAKLNGEKGNTIHEDNSLYELYPYQVRWN
ncbi:MAG: hypothetical protein R6V36_08930 [Psychroflexus sp.]